MQDPNIKEKLPYQRSQIIEWFINIETLIDGIICQHYLKKIYSEFLFEVLYDEYFTTGLKIRILEKIVDGTHRGMLNRLHRLNTIRNYFAHVGREIIRGSSKSGPSYIPDPRAPKKPVNFNQLFKEFQEGNREVIEELAEIYKKMGGILEK